MNTFGDAVWKDTQTSVALLDRASSRRIRRSSGLYRYRHHGSLPQPVSSPAVSASEYPKARQGAAYLPAAGLRAQPTGNGAACWRQSRNCFALPARLVGAQAKAPGGIRFVTRTSLRRMRCGDGPPTRPSCQCNARRMARRRGRAFRWFEVPVLDLGLS